MTKRAPALAVRRTSAGDWRYKAEGAENLTVQYAGSSEAQLAGMVLRLRKGEKNGVTVADEVAYAQRVVAPLLGDEFVLPMEVVDLEDDFVSGVLQAVEAERPERRRTQKSSCSRPDRAAVLMPDCTLLHGVTDAAPDSPTLCVEIKPKWGFLPSSGHLSAETGAAKRRFCRFCMHQYLKHSKKRAGPEAGYCPLQLFSGHPGPMREALAALYARPQNNFRVFTDGKLVYGEEAEGGGEAVLEQAARALLGEVAGSDPTGAFLDAVGAALRASGVLDRVRRLQALDRLDVEAVHALYEAHAAAPPPAAADPDTVDGKAAMVPRLLRVLSGEERLPGEVRLADAAGEGRSLALAAFAVSATAKDLSLMLSLRRLRRPSPGCLAPAGLPPLACAVWAVDLAVKPLARVPHYRELDARVVAHFLSHGPAGRAPCRPDDPPG